MPNFVWIFVFFLGLTDSRNIKFPATTNHHRHTRQLISERSILPYTLDGFIISECKHHELTAENESKLQSAIENMYSCFNRKTLFVSSQSDFLNNMEECSKTPKELATICLPWKLKYLPDLYFQYAKSMVKLLYQDNSIIQSTSMSNCIKKFMENDTITNYANCLAKQQRGFNENDPFVSKKRLCSAAKGLAQCFTDTLLTKCEKNADLKTFTQDFLKTRDEPCAGDE